MYSAKILLNSTPAKGNIKYFISQFLIYILFHNKCFISCIKSCNHSAKWYIIITDFRRKTYCFPKVQKL